MTDAEFAEQMRSFDIAVEKWKQAQQRAKDKLVALGLTEEEVASIFEGPQI